MYKKDGLRLANKDKLPENVRKLAFENPGEQFLLPNGVEVYYIVGRGYRLYAYHDKDYNPWI